MDTVFTEYQHEGYTIQLSWDQYADDPTDYFDTSIAFLGEVKNSRHLSIGNQRWPKNHAYAYIPWGEGPWVEESDEYPYLNEDELRDEYEGEKEEGYVVYPVELVPYGGGNYALRECDHEEADGYIFVASPFDPLELLASTDQPHPDERKDEILRVYNLYLSGEIIRATVRNADGDVLDSCGGFYSEEEAREWAENDSVIGEMVETEFFLLYEDGTWSHVKARVPSFTGQTGACSWFLEHHPIPGLMGISLSEHVEVPPSEERQTDNKEVA